MMQRCLQITSINIPSFWRVAEPLHDDAYPASKKKIYFPWRSNLSIIVAEPLYVNAAPATERKK
jgi:hypothetical protein